MRCVFWCCLHLRAWWSQLERAVLLLPHATCYAMEQRWVPGEGNNDVEAMNVGCRGHIGKCEGYVRIDGVLLG